MSDRSISRSFNSSSFGHNTNIQSDNNTSFVNLSEKLPDDIFTKLDSEITELVKDPTEKEQALEFSQNLKDAVEKGDVTSAEKYGKWLDRIISGSSALAAIVQAFQSH